MTPKIIFNGKEYNRLEDMPPEARRAYQQAMGMLADKNQNGVPDFMEGMMVSGNIPTTTQSTANVVTSGPVQFGG